VGKEMEMRKLMAARRGADQSSRLTLINPTEPQAPRVAGDRWQTWTVVDHGKSTETEPVVVETAAEDEWIVGARAHRALHVYRFPGTGWLVSEVGRVNEGRGVSLKDALAALAGDSPAPDWWRSVPEALAAQSGTD
jgi:hypothetical protein